MDNEDYRLAERENDNLRAALKVALGACSAEIVAKVGTMIARPIDDGGVVEDGREEDEAERHRLASAGTLLRQIAESLRADDEGMFRISKGLPKDWPTQALRLASDLEEYAPAKPIMLSAREMAERAAKSK